MSRQSFWADRSEGVDFAVADLISQRAFQLPSRPDHGPGDLRHVWNAVCEAGGSTPNRVRQ